MIQKEYLVIMFECEKGLHLNLRTSLLYALFKPCWLGVTTIVIHFSFFQVSLCSQNLGGCKKITVNGRIQQTTSLSKGKITTEFHIYDNQQITVYWWYPTANYCQASWLNTWDNFPMSSRVNYRIRQNKALERIMQLHLTIDGMEQHHVNVEIQQTASQIQYMYIKLRYLIALPCAVQ